MTVLPGMETVWVLVRGSHLLQSRTLWSCFKPRIHHCLPLPRGIWLDPLRSRDIWLILIFGMFVIIGKLLQMRRQTFNQLLAALAVCDILWDHPPSPQKNDSNYIHVQLQDYRSCYAVWPKMFLSGILCSMCLSTPAPPSLLSIIGLNCPQSSHRYPMEKSFLAR